MIRGTTMTVLATIIWVNVLTIIHASLFVNLLRPFGKAAFFKVPAGGKRVDGKYLALLSIPLSKAKLQGFVASMSRRVGKNSVFKMRALDSEPLINFVEVTGDEFAVNKIRHSKHIRAVEEVQIFTKQGCSCQAQNNPDSWGLDRTDQRTLPLNNWYASSMPTSSNVDIYIADTGIYTGHNDFGGRAIFGVNTAGGSSSGDVDGHGTHVAGTAGGTNYGIAKRSRLVAVKVLGDDGSGSTIGIVEGLLWIINHRKQNKNRRGVVNMSLGGLYSPLLNLATDWVRMRGTIVVVAAGNSFFPASTCSPASAFTAVTVGCSTSSDRFCSFSNWGRAVDIIAPGYNIKSAVPGGVDAHATYSGTSMSAPHVAGAIANYLGCNPSVTNKGTLDWLRRSSSKGKLSRMPILTTNELLNYACSGGAVKYISDYLLDAIQLVVGIFGIQL